MTAKTAVSAASAPLADPLVAWTQLGDLGRQQFSVAAEGAAALFRGFDAIRAAQQQTFEQAASQYLAALRMLSAPYQPAELMAVESELLESDAQEVGHYWQQLASSTLQSQLELMQQASRFFSGAATPLPVLPKRQGRRSGAA